VLVTGSAVDDPRFSGFTVLQKPYDLATFEATVMRRFCRAYGLDLAPRGHSVFYDDAWWNVLCFSKAEDADRFKAAFDGTSFNPRDRGTGQNWAQWNPGRRKGSGRGPA
jgi:hypothetical protein